MKMFRYLILCCLALVCCAKSPLSQQSCSKTEIFLVDTLCYLTDAPIIPQSPKVQGDDPVYVLYSVNPVEGFNLRRDVFLRLAIFIKKLRTIKGYSRAYLVLPSFIHLFHWRSHFSQTNIFWNHFFDLDSMKLYSPGILDMWEFFDIIIREKGYSQIEIDVYKLQHFESMFESGVFVDKFEESACTRNEYGNYHYFEYFNITENTVTCVNFQGSSFLLADVLKQYEPRHHVKGTNRILLIAHAEVVLHENFGSPEYWKARRSLRFNKNLQAIADAYRQDFFGSFDEGDGIHRSEKWTDDKPHRNAKGGNYLCVHMRRADFIFGREHQIPTLRSVAYQIKKKAAELGLNRVYVSSDCSGSEFHDIRNLLRGISMYKFKPPSEYHAQLGDGGLAIIDQIICSHARWFIGTFESTFTYRIYEEREILGFPVEATFNTLCKREDMIDCNKNAAWTIQY